MTTPIVFLCVLSDGTVTRWPTWGEADTAAREAIEGAIAGDPESWLDRRGAEVAIGGRRAGLLTATVREWVPPTHRALTPETARVGLVVQKTTRALDLSLSLFGQWRIVAIEGDRATLRHDSGRIEVVAVAELETEVDGG